MDRPFIMFPVLLTLGITMALAVGAGFALRGTPRRLAELRFIATPMLMPAVAAGIAPLFIEMPDAAVRALMVAANLVVAAWIIINIAGHSGAVRVGLALLLAGWLLNAIVITLNGAMPLSRWAYAQSGQDDAITAGEGGFFKIEEADASTRLRFLGDAIPIRPVRQVLSFGDIALMLGIGVVVAGGMRGSSAAIQEPHEPTPSAVG